MLPYTTAVIVLISSYYALALHLNDNQLAYLSAELSPRDCRRLIASMQSGTYGLPDDLHLRERKLLPHEKCFDLLGKWYDDEGGKTSFSFVELRLNQLGQHHLAQWLNKQVLSGLTEDFEHSGDKGEKKVKRAVSGEIIDDFNNTMTQVDLIKSDLHYIGLPLSSKSTMEESATEDDEELIEILDEESGGYMDSLLAFCAGTGTLLSVIVCLKMWWSRQKKNGCKNCQYC